MGRRAKYPNETYVQRKIRLQAPKSADAKATVALKKVNNLSSVIKKAEVGHIETAFSMQPYAANPSSAAFVYPAVGTGQTQRKGNAFSIISIALNGYIVAPNLLDQASIASPYVKLYIVRRNDGYSASTLTVSEIFAEGTVSEGLRFRNPNHAKDYKIVYEKVIPINYSAASEGATSGLINVCPVTKNVSFYKKFKRPLKIRMNGNEATTATNNQFYLLLISPTATASKATFTGGGRIRFTDM